MKYPVTLFSFRCDSDVIDSAIITKPATMTVTTSRNGLDGVSRGKASRGEHVHDESYVKELWEAKRLRMVRMRAFTLMWRLILIS